MVGIVRRRDGSARPREEGSAIKQNHCPNCGASRDSAATFCGQCGGALTRPLDQLGARMAKVALAMALLPVVDYVLALVAGLNVRSATIFFLIIASALLALPLGIVALVRLTRRRATGAGIALAAVIVSASFWALLILLIGFAAALSGGFQ